MKKLIILSAIFWASICNAQTWAALGTGTDSVMSLNVYNGQLIAGGFFDSAGGVSSSSIAAWNGSTWSSLDGGLHYDTGVNVTFPHIAYALTTFNGDLYAGGFFTFAGETLSDHFAEWNGSSWDTLLAGPTNCGVLSLANYNGNLILGGEFINAGFTPANFIVAWDGSSWSALGSGMNHFVYALTTYNGNLIAAGQFDSAGGAPADYIAEWNGSSWSPMGAGMNASVYGLTVFNGKLYAAGVFDSAGGKPAEHVAEWNGTSWNSLGNGLYSSAWALTVYDSNLIVGGFMNITAWNGTSWNSIDGGVNNWVNALTVYNGDLYAGGFFTEIGGIPAKGVAELTSPLGINAIHNNDGNVQVFPNPSNGSFTLSLSNINEKCSVEIYNMLGESVLKEILRSAQDDKVMDLRGQPNGVYFYRVIKESGGLVGSGKVVIEK